VGGRGAASVAAGAREATLEVEGVRQGRRSGVEDQARNMSTQSTTQNAQASKWDNTIRSSC
jgi:hypothetical protein